MSTIQMRQPTEAVASTLSHGNFTVDPFSKTFDDKIYDTLENRLGVLAPRQAGMKFFGPKALLMQLNEVFNTSLEIDYQPLELLLGSFISQGLDFGAIYARLRQIWPVPLDFSRRDRVWWSMRQRNSWLEIETVERFSFVERDASQNEAQNAVESGLGHKLQPQRLWDLRANRIIPHRYSRRTRRHPTFKAVLEDYPFCVIEHDWKENTEKISTPINEHEWLVPVPRSFDLETIRILLLNAGLEYVWLDVLCLRQESQDPVKEEMRREEWAIDLPILDILAKRTPHRVVKYAYRNNRIEIHSRPPLFGVELADAQVPLQEEVVLHHDVLTSKQADAFYTSAEHVVVELNAVFDTALTVDPLRDLLNSYISQGLDFGSIYARVRPNVDPLSIKTNFLWPMKSDYPNARTGTGSERDDVTFRAISIGTPFAERHGRLDERNRENSIDGQSIVNHSGVKPRRLWDLLANRVVPYEYSYSFRRREESTGDPLDYPFCAISHSWADDMVNLDTPINGREWLVPVPKGVELDAVRTELLNMGVDYVWVDVLCLRQHGLDPTKEDIRMQEWEVDLPTIGVVFNRYAHRVVRYLNGLGRALQAFGWDHERHWLNRAWTLQEVKSDSLMGGIPEGVEDPREVVSSDTDERLGAHLDLIDTIEARQTVEAFPLLVNSMRHRNSANPVDKVLGIAMMCCNERLPLYKEKEDTEMAWATCVKFLPPEFVIMFIFNCLTPGDVEVTWRPSWRQLMSIDAKDLFGSHFNLDRIRRPVSVSLDGIASYQGPYRTGHFTPTKSGRGLIDFHIYYGRSSYWVRLDANTKLEEGDYSLVGCYEHERHWVICARSANYPEDDYSFEKLAVMTIGSRGDDIPETEGGEAPSKYSRYEEEEMERNLSMLFGMNEPRCTFV